MDIILYILTCIWTFISNPFYGFVVFLAISLAIATVFAINNRTTNPHKMTRLTYVHLAAIFTPILLFGGHMNCSGGLLACGMPAIISQFILGSFLATIISVYLILPMVYPILYRARRIAEGRLYERLNTLSATLDLKTPKLYVADCGLPISFSVSGVRPAVFISVAMLELMKERELDAIFVHELTHIRNSTPNLKSLVSVARLFSPLYMLVRADEILQREELHADISVLQISSLSPYLYSAKAKISAVNI
ncbi:MAG: M48 family metalloprotease [Candidatus Micrarchaeota archaeon]|nr:M48 family metalloprotease [Candidatus Micrarchaeota archaeon]